MQVGFGQLIKTIEARNRVCICFRDDNETPKSLFPERETIKTSLSFKNILLQTARFASILSKHGSKLAVEWYQE